VSERIELFTSKDIFLNTEEILLEALTKSACDAHIYLFMPDHCHLLIEGMSEISDLWKCIVEFKQKSGYLLARNYKTLKWQKDFYDHILRKEEDLEKQVRYILGNPLRKGLVEDWNEYQYKGSTVYDFNKW
jgi:putative transposase